MPVRVGSNGGHIPDDSVDLFISDLFVLVDGLSN